jgi:hypothetical protein
MDALERAVSVERGGRSFGIARHWQPVPRINIALEALRQQVTVADLAQRY